MCQADSGTLTTVNALTPIPHSTPKVLASLVPNVIPNIFPTLVAAQPICVNVTPEHPNGCQMAQAGSNLLKRAITCGPWKTVSNS